MRKLLLIIILFLLFTQSSYSKWTDSEKEILVNACAQTMWQEPTNKLQDEQYEEIKKIRPGWVLLQDPYAKEKKQAKKVMCTCDVEKTDLEWNITPEEYLKLLKIENPIDQKKILEGNYPDNLTSEEYLKLYGINKTEKEYFESMKKNEHITEGWARYKKSLKEIFPDDPQILEKMTEINTGCDKLAHEKIFDKQFAKLKENLDGVFGYAGDTYPKRSSEEFKKKENELSKGPEPEEEKDSADEIAKLKETDTGVFGYAGDAYPKRSPAEFKKKEPINEIGSVDKEIKENKKKLTEKKVTAKKNKDDQRVKEIKVDKGRGDETPAEIIFLNCFNIKDKEKIRTFVIDTVSKTVNHLDITLSNNLKVTKNGFNFSNTKVFKDILDKRMQQKYPGYQTHIIKWSINRTTGSLTQITNASIPSLSNESKDFKDEYQCEKGSDKRKF